MVNSDTVKLLKECNSGIKMGISTLEDVIPKVSDDKFRDILEKSLDENTRLGKKTAKALENAGDDGKEPPSMAKGMAWIKTNVMLAMEDSDEKAASLITDGCHMGIKSINKYLNEYKEADSLSKDIAKQIVEIEENLAQDIRIYL